MTIRTAVPADLDGILNYDRHICVSRLESCIRRGLVDVLLSTQEDETSKFFYEKLGYRLCGDFLPPDQEARELMYRKELGT